jgi:hypothetical protein
LRKLIGQARRRILSNELFRQGANSGSAALSAFILLLLFGTEILKWQFLISIPLAAAGLGIYRAKKRLPSLYLVAQLVDRRLDLADSLSTALFFDQIHPRSPVPSDMRRAQFEAAGRLAATVDIRRAVPYRAPRSAYTTAGLLVVAMALFGLRYGISRQLDLKQPIAHFLPDSFSVAKPGALASDRASHTKRKPLAPEDETPTADPEEQRPKDPEPNAEARTPSESQPETKPAADTGSTPPQKNAEPADEQMAAEEEAGDGNASDKSAPEDQTAQRSSPRTGQPGKSQSSDRKEGNSESENSLMSKMKDAFQNLLSKVTAQPKQQSAPSPANQPQSAKSGKQSGSKARESKDGRTEKGGQQAAAQEDGDGQEAKNSEDALQNRGEGKSDSEQRANQPGNGIGSQNGDKAIRKAEQLAAMGKISEILGKRAANVTGETSVEVQSTAQQLRTPYARVDAEHRQGGAEIARDEVPVALQPYVERYFEQLRPRPGRAEGAAASPRAKKQVRKK